MSLRVGVIGCGWWSTFAHLPALAADERAEIAALVDPDPRRLADVGERFGVARRYASTPELLAAGELDAVVIAVPHHEHHPVAVACLRAGLHVLLEKPMTLDPAHARELIALARAHARELVIGYPWHYNPHALAIHDALAAGRIGDVEYVSGLFASMVRELYAGRPESYRDAFGYALHGPASTTYSDPAGGGQAQTQVTHLAALLLRIAGLRVRQVSALTANAELGVDLMDAIALRFEGGGLAVLGSTGGVTPGHEELLELRIFGREGHVTFEAYEGTAAFFDRDGVERLPVLDPSLRYPEWAPVRNLIELALGEEGAVNRSPAELGLATVEVIDAIYRSAASGRVVELNGEDA